MAADAAARRRRNAFIGCVVGVCAMVGLAYASVPLYRRFCQITGFNGTPTRAEEGPTAAQATDRPLTVRFDTNVRKLPWDFAPEHTTQDIKVGAASMAYFKVTNNGDHSITGRASYNVSPESAGQYLVKTQCFCFTDQTIPAHKTIEFSRGLLREAGLRDRPQHRSLQRNHPQLHLLPEPGRQAGESCRLSRRSAASRCVAKPPEPL